MFSIDHLGIAVKSLAAAKGIYEKLGLSVSSEEIKVGAGGHRYVFVHPASAGGVLLELAEEH